MGKFRDRQEILTAFETLKKALMASCASYDRGERWEALRLSTPVYTLVHDGGKNSRSLLTQIGIKDKILFVATGPEIVENNMLDYTPLVYMSMNQDTACYTPRLNERPELKRHIRFGQWWERDLIFKGGGDGARSASGLTRKNLVFALRNKEGGAHFDAKLTDENYIEVVYRGAWEYHPVNGEAFTIPDLHLAMMRQIAYEVLESLDSINLNGRGR